MNYEQQRKTKKRICEAGAFSRGRCCRRDELRVPDALRGSFTADRAEQCSLLIIFRIALSLSFFWVLGERLLPLARYTHRSLLQAPAYLAHTSTVSLSLLDTSWVPNHYRLQSSRITKPPNGTVPFDSSNSEVM